MNNFTTWVNKQLHYTDLQDLPPPGPDTSVNIFFTEIFWCETTDQSIHISINIDPVKIWDSLGWTNKTSGPGTGGQYSTSGWKIIKMFRMEITDQYPPVRKSISGAKVKFKWPLASHGVIAREPVVRPNTLEQSLGTDCGSIIHHYREENRGSISTSNILWWKISFCPRLSHSSYLF